MVAPHRRRFRLQGGVLRGRLQPPSLPLQRQFPFFLAAKQGHHHPPHLHRDLAPVLILRPLRRQARSGLGDLLERPHVPEPQGGRYGPHRHSCAPSAQIGLHLPRLHLPVPAHLDRALLQLRRHLRRPSGPQASLCLHTVCPDDHLCASVAIAAAAEGGPQPQSLDAGGRRPASTCAVRCFNLSGGHGRRLQTAVTNLLETQGRPQAPQPHTRLATLRLGL